MKKFKLSLSGVLVFLLVQLVASGAFAQEKRFQIGIQAGPFIPQNFMIQGLNEVDYSNGSPVSASIGGFGNGNALSVSAFYYFSGWGINFKSGIRLFQKNKFDKTLAPSGTKDYYENNLNIVPVTLSIINRISLADSKFVPYFGMGAGILYATWEQKHYPEGGTRTWLKGSAYPVDFHFLTGFNFPIYHDLLFNGEIEYCYEPANWKIKNVDSNDVAEYKNLNIGGIALKLGLAFQF